MQSITLAYTMMEAGQEQPGIPDVKKCIVVTPTSLVGNWSQEVEKWIPGRVEHIALTDSSKEKVGSHVLFRGLCVIPRSLQSAVGA